MNKEIKEILDYLKNDDYSPVFADEGCDDTPYKLFDEEEIKILLDYITNLQNEIDRLNNIINELEKYINNQDYWLCELGYKEFTPYMPVKKLLDKLKELKGEDKE